MPDEAIPQRFELSVVIDASAERVWRSLTSTGTTADWRGEPEMDIEVETTWEVGSPVTVRAFHIVRQEMTGMVLEAEPPHRLVYTHRSSVSRLPDGPSSYTTLDFRLAPAGERTTLTLVATGFPTRTIYKHIEFYWRETLGCLKRHAEEEPGRVWTGVA